MRKSFQSIFSVTSLIFLGVWDSSLGNIADRDNFTLTDIVATALPEKASSKVEVIVNNETTIDEMQGTWVSYMSKAIKNLKLTFKSIPHLEVYALDNFCQAKQMGPMDRYLNIALPGGPAATIAKISPATPGKINSLTVHYSDASGNNRIRVLSCSDRE